MRPLVCLAALLTLAGGCRGRAPEATLRPGETVEGTLAPGDPVFASDGSFYDLYAVRAEPGEELDITLASGDFDAYLAGGPTPDEAIRGAQQDDDSGGGLDARLFVRADAAGRYVVRVNTRRGGETGAYVLSVASARGGMDAMPVSASVLRLGGAVQGRLEPGDEVLSDGSFADPYVVELPAGERFVAQMASGDLDAFVSVVAVVDGVPTVIAENDDGGAGTDARVSFASKGGTYAIQANSARGGETGAYVLRLDRAPSAADVDRERFPGQWVSAGYGPSRRYAAVRDLVQRERWLEGSLAGLGEAFPLPRDVRVGFEECGEVNATYDPTGPAVTYCYELVAFFDEILSRTVPADRHRSATRGAYAFVMLHEAGHAVVDQRDLPITGREEDVVDQFAALHLIREGFDGAWAAMDGVLGLQGNGMFSRSDFAGEHSLGPQRFFNVACLVYGSDPRAYAALVGPDGLPEERAARCPGEYAQVDKAFDRLLTPPTNREIYDDLLDTPGGP